MAIIKPDPPTLYCDASRTLGGSYTVVAGAVASVQGWLDFDKEWCSALRDNSLRYFRMSEFAHSTGEFAKHWKGYEKRRQEFFLRLAHIIVDHVAFWVGASVSQRHYEAADQIYQLHEYQQPYTVCGLTCIDLARKWRDANHLEYLSMEYVFEEGDRYAGQLRQRCKEYFGTYPIFRPKLSDDDSAREELVTPLQVGDIAAYEIGKAYVGLDPGTEDPFERFRTSFLMLGDIPNRWGEVEEHALRVEMNLRKIPSR